MLILNALAATFVVPAWIALFRPRFIIRAAGAKVEETGEFGMSRGSANA